MSGAALQLHSIRLVTEHGLSFKALDYDAFQDIIQPMIKAMPAAERYERNIRFANTIKKQKNYNYDNYEFLPFSPQGHHFI